MQEFYEVARYIGFIKFAQKLDVELANESNPGDDRKRNNTVQTYFDTERQEYRYFKRLNLVKIN